MLIINYTGIKQLLSRQFHVSEIVKEVFDIEPFKDTDPDVVVAKGTGIHAEVCFGEIDRDIVIVGHSYMA